MPSIFRPISLAVWFCVVWFCVVSSTAGAAGPRHILISATENIRTETYEIGSGQVDLKTSAEWSVRKTTLHGGKQEGVELITIDNGELILRLIPTRGMSILDVRYRDMRLGWNSPVKEVVHPKWINLDSRDGLGWLEGFNEWMVRCGLEYAGHPGRDQFVDNTGATAEMDLTLHGRIGNLPASELVVEIDLEPPHRIRVRGLVYERQFYGPKLRLAAEVSTEIGSLTFRIQDTVTNQGGADQEMQLIYHSNFGRPLLEKGAKLIVAASEIAPMNAHAAKSIDRYDTYQGPTPGFIEEVYLFKPRADAEGKTTVLLQNAAGDRGASVRWSLQELPYLTVWKNTTAEADGYVTGIEPGTCYPYNRRVEREFGRVVKMRPGEQRSFTLDFALHHGAQAVGQARDAVTAIRNGDTKIRRDPPVTP